MYILPISNDPVQTFGFDMDFYPSRITLKCPQIECEGVNQYPVLDLFLDGFNPVYGIPLIPNADLLGSYIANGCLPLDLGALVALSDVNGVVSCETLSSGTAALAYIDGATTAFTSLYGARFG